MFVFNTLTFDIVTYQISYNSKYRQEIDIFNDDTYAFLVKGSKSAMVLQKKKF